MKAVFSGQTINARDGTGVTGEPTGTARSIAPSSASITIIYDTTIGEGYSNNFGGIFLAGGSGFVGDPVTYPNGPITSISMTAYGQTFSIGTGLGSGMSFNGGRLDMSARNTSPVVGGNNEDFIAASLYVPNSVMPSDFATPFTYSAPTTTDTFSSFAIYGFDSFFTDNVSDFGGGFALDTVTVSEATAPVPLPAGLPMLLAGLGALAWMRRQAA